MSSTFQRAYFPAMATLAAGLLATTAAMWLTSQMTRLRDGERFAQEAKMMARAIEQDFQRLNSVLLDLREQLPTPLSLSNLPSRLELARFLPPELTNRMTSVGVALLVSPTNVSAWTEAVRKRFQTNLHLVPPGPPAALFRTSMPGDSTTYITERAYLPVTEVALLADGQQCDCDNFKLGADLFRSGNPSEEQASSILEVIRDGTATTVMRGIDTRPQTNRSGPIAGRLRQDFLSIAPIYRGGTTGVLQSLPQRFAETSGLLFLFVDAVAVVAHASAPWQDRLRVEAETGGVTGEGRRVDLEPLVMLATHGEAAYQRANLEVVLGGFRIFLSITSLPRWDWAAGRAYPWATGVLGGILSVLAAAWVARQIRRGLASEAEAGELRTANAAMAAARETRGFITRELHDNTLQNLYVLSLELTQSRARLRESPDEAAAALDLGLEEIRRISSDLRRFLVSESQSDPPLAADQVFTAIVERVRRGTSTQIRLDLDPQAIVRLSARCSAELSQILREALSNALRHGQPREIIVELKTLDTEGWTFAIADDGKGFMPSAPSSGLGQGRQNMLRRCELMDAAFQLSSEPGKGTRVVVTFAVTASAPFKSGRDPL